MGLTEDRLARLSEQDVHFLVTSVVRRRSDYEHIANIVRDKPDLLDVMLDDPALAERLEADQAVLLQISPFLLFHILIRRAHRDLREKVFTVEVGHDGRLPIFDAREAASLLDDHHIRTYLAEMLSSFTRTETATVVFKGRRGFVRRTYSDLSVDDMIELSGMVEESSRFPFFKRVADVCLFLTGMFPEHLIARATGDGIRRVRKHGQRSLADYEELGKEFYQKAAELHAGDENLTGIFKILADAFTLARKPLSLIAQQYVPQQRREWFSPGLDSTVS